MKIKVKAIPQEGLDINEEHPASFVSDAKDEIKFTGTIKLSAHIDKTDSALIAQVYAKGVLATDCARCLEPVRNKWEKDFSLDFTINKNTEFVEMDEDIRQEIVISLPTRILCKENCKGLCPKCGENLNVKKCKCK